MRSHTARPSRRRAALLTTLLASAALAAPSLGAQQPGGQPATQPAPNPRAAMTREANQLDTQGKTKEARALFQRLVDEAPDAAARAASQRAMAMSYAFDGDCANAIKYEQMVIEYWKTREQAEPQNAFYQEGEMANEAARVCIDNGKLDEAEKWYKAGQELGNKEPAPRTHPASLWAYRTEHALARLAARRGKKAEAMQHVAEARKILDGDATMAAQQERFYPYLTGYVALYTNDLATAEADLTRAIGMQGNGSDPFMHYLLAMTLEKKGDAAAAKGHYQRAYELATAHNPPAAYVRPNARKKLGLP